MKLSLQIIPETIRADYDRDVDVLYIIKGEARPIEGDGRPGGVELDYALDDDTPCGVTIIGFEAHGWRSSLAELAAIAGDHLAVPAFTIERAMSSAIGAPLKIRGL